MHVLALAGACESSHYLGPTRDALAEDASARDGAPPGARARRGGRRRDGRDAATQPTRSGSGRARRGRGTDDPFGSRLSCAQQFEESLDGIPDELRCIGLYTHVGRKLVAPGVRAYAPAVPLWSDGSGKQRWICLPAGTVIDATDPDEWKFPVGTKFFKEFRANGRRVETRLYQKTGEDRWARATFEWNEDETAAIALVGATAPTSRCTASPTTCRTGASATSATRGARIASWASRRSRSACPAPRASRWSSSPTKGCSRPSPSEHGCRIGDDGTDVAALALGWLHINCGVSCHNDNENSEAYSSGLRLKLYTEELDGRPPVDFEAMRTTVGVKAKTMRFGQATRIVPGSPASSLVYQLLSSRSSEREQMPPIASRVVDIHNTQIVEDSIRAMPVDWGCPRFLLLALHASGHWPHLRSGAAQRLK